MSYDDVRFPSDKPRLSPIRGARLNATYCLVRLTYLQAKMLFLAADQMTDDSSDAFHNIGWSGKEAKAFHEAIDKLGETAGRWP